jgi:hypothetical protein
LLAARSYMAVFVPMLCFLFCSMLYTS